MLVDYRVFVAARLKSTRLKRKALLEINGRPLVDILFSSLTANIPRDKIVLCTSNSVEDDELEILCRRAGISCHRGDGDDVILRFLTALKFYPAEVVVRVTGDNPLTDGQLILDMLQFHQEGGFEYTKTESFPIGMRAEVISVATLEQAHEKLRAPENSEYMTYMLNRPDRYRVGVYTEPGLDPMYSNASVTVDTKEDFEQLKAIFDASGEDVPTRENILRWFDKNRHSIKNETLVDQKPLDLKQFGYHDDQP